MERPKERPDEAKQDRPLGGFMAGEHSEGPRVQIDSMEKEAVELAREMARRLGSTDANDTGPTICAIWNLGAEARRLASILEQLRTRIMRA